MKTNWKTEIDEEMQHQNDYVPDWGNVVACTLSPDELLTEFDAGYGGEEGSPFTVWTEKRVYFPWCYDGSEGCASVSRLIDWHPTRHIGGG